MACALTPFGMENGTSSSPPPSGLNTEKSHFLRQLLESKTFYDYILTARGRLIPEYFNEVFVTMTHVPSHPGKHEASCNTYLFQKLADFSVSCFEAALSEQQRALRSEGQKIGDSEGETTGTDSSDKKSLPDDQQITMAFPTEMKNLISSFLPEISMTDVPVHPMPLTVRIALQERTYDTLCLYFIDMLPKYMRVARRLGKSGLLVSRKMLDGWHHLQDNYHLLDLSALRHFGYTVGSLDEGENAGRPFIIWYPDDVVTPAGNIFEDRLHDIGEGQRLRRGGGAAVPAVAQ